MFVVGSVLITSLCPGSVEHAHWIRFLDGGDFPEAVVETWFDRCDCVLAHGALAFFTSFAFLRKKIKVYKAKIHNDHFLESPAVGIAASALKSQTFFGKSPVRSRLVPLLRSQRIRSCDIDEFRGTTTPQSQYQMNCGFLLNIIVAQSLFIFKLLPRKMRRCWSGGMPSLF